jgi:hypothetical protein
LITPVARQVLVIGPTYAPDGSPQTQFDAPASQAAQAAALAITNYADAEKGGASPIPPAGVNVYPDGGTIQEAVWHPAGEELAPTTPAVETPTA